MNSAARDRAPAGSGLPRGRACHAARARPRARRQLRGRGRARRAAAGRAGRSGGRAGGRAAGGSRRAEGGADSNGGGGGDEAARRQRAGQAGSAVGLPPMRLRSIASRTRFRAWVLVSRGGAEPAGTGRGGTNRKVT
jgi:hypothetical protein